MRKILLLICLLLVPLLAMQAQTVSVTFQVDMTVQIAKGAFNPAQNQVSARGSFNGWGETAMSDGDNDSVYTVTVAGITQSSNVLYKYFHSGGGGTWEGDPDKQVAVGTADTTVPVRLFNFEEMPSGDTADVTFEVDMRLPAQQDGGFLSRKVYVAGNFTDWGTGAIEMLDANSDTIYSVVVPLPSAQLLQYKYLHSPDSASNGTWEDGDNRTYWVVDGAQIVTRFFNDVDPNVTLADGNILFNIDMSVFETLGIYDQEADSLQLRSVFNGWNDQGDPAKWRMTQDVTDPNAWGINVPFESEIVNGSYNYKYFVKFADSAQAANWPDGYERPASQGGGNRPVTFEGSSNQIEDPVYYDDILPDYVIQAGTNLQVKFSVDMRPAVGGSVEFEPGNHTVYWISESPAFVYTQGWVDSDTMKVLELTDADNDTVYEGTLDIQAPSFNSFLYRYAFNKGDGTWGHEPDGGPGAVDGYRRRYVGQDVANSFPINPWEMRPDEWTTAAVKTGHDEDPYTVYDITAVQPDGGGVPMSYSLHQNFPNPFNPSTVIKFDLSTKERVSLKVYNILGQEVATLVNEDLNPGNYKITFDAKGLASGMYLYRISAGSFVQTKRMLLLK